MASDGLSNRQIGDRLFLSPRTVSSHLYRSYPKLGVASRHQLRDVIALTSTLTKAPETRPFYKSLTRSLDPTSAHVRDPGTWYLGYGDELATWVRATEGPDPAKARGHRHAGRATGIRNVQ
jgi:hypothetical protein